MGEMGLESLYGGYWVHKNNKIKKTFVKVENFFYLILNKIKALFFF